MVETALMVALALILDRIEFAGPWVMGGSISLVMLPIFVMAFRRGLKVGLMTGLLVGVIKLILGSSMIHPIQFLLDYPVAFTVLGLAGAFAFRNKKGELNIRWALFGLFFASFFRLVAHIISGGVWFGEYAPEGWNVWLYSAVYNTSYLVPETLITFGVILLIAKTQPAFFKLKNRPARLKSSVVS